MKIELNPNNDTNISKLLILIIMGLGLSGCSPFFDNQVESTIYDDARYYVINSENILNYIDHGNTDVFNQVDELPTPNPLLLSKNFGWSQEDYFRVARSLFREVWQESYAEQSVYAMNFSMGCSDVETGLFQEAELISYTLDQSKEEEIRIEYHLQISPSKNTIFFTKAGYTPNLNKKEPIDLTLFKIPAEGALQIAETNGGTKTRLSYGNECIINVIATGWDDEGWDIYYQIRENNSWWKVFEIRVNPQTGAFKVLRIDP